MNCTSCSEQPSERPTVSRPTYSAISAMVHPDAAGVSGVSRGYSGIAMTPASALTERRGRRRLHNRLRLGAVLGDLGLEGVDGGELHVGADEIEELEGDHLAVQVAVEVEQEHL